MDWSPMCSFYDEAAEPAGEHDLLELQRQLEAGLGPVTQPSVQWSLW